MCPKIIDKFREKASLYIPKISCKIPFTNFSVSGSYSTTLTGDYSYSPGVICKIDISGSQLNEFKLALSGPVTLDINKTVSVQNGVSFSKEVPPPSPILIGAVAVGPAVFTIEFIPSVGIDFSAVGKMDVSAGFESSGNLTVGVDYHDGIPYPVFSFVDGELNPFYTISDQMSYSARPYLETKFGFYFWDLLGPYFDVQPYVKAAMIQNPELHHDLSYGVMGHIGGELKFLTKTFFDLNLELGDINIPYTVPRYKVSGRVTSGGVGLAGVRMTLSGKNTVSVLTDGTGGYTIVSVEKGSYTLTPSLSGYSFDPSSIPVNVNNGDVFVSDIQATGSSDPVSQLLSSLVTIPAGSFMMGSTDNENGWAQYTTPVHLVTLQAFDIGKYEVTQAQYLAVMGTNPSYFKDPSYPGSMDRPVEYVSWYDARAFCTALSTLTGRTFTLPSEAQWEYACRAGTTTLYSWGDSDSLIGDYAWYWYNSDGSGGPYGTHPVGTKLPNPWGLFDMQGNVWEWCLDSWHTNYIGAPNDGSAWEPDTGSGRMLRGGGWGFDIPGYFRSALRINYYSPVTRFSSLGFRVLAVQ